jgi:chorismate mutase/prephenate dehydratase
MSLEELRKKIDEADDRIVKLIAERVRQAQEIGQEKQKKGMQIEDAAREERVLAHVREIARTENLSEKEIEIIYRQIVNLSKSVQGVVVAFQGEIGAYSEEACFHFFGPGIQVKPLETLDEVFHAVEQGDVRYGVVPVENSLEGSIANPFATLDSIKRVYSHPQALGQSQAFLRHLNAELVSTYDTAGSVKLIKEQNIKDGAAVASARAAEIYGMKILAREIEDNPNNFTRFFILGREDSALTGSDKTSIVFSVKHQPGALFAVLEAFADSNISLTKIESRPTRQKAWEYNFYLDFEGHRQDAAVKTALRRVEKQALFLKILGSYPKAA